MSSRGVLVSIDSIESCNEFPIEVSSLPARPRTPRSPNNPHIHLDYFDKIHRGGKNNQ